MMRPRPLALILGLGRFGGGRAAAQFLAQRGFELRIADSADPTTLNAARLALQDCRVPIDWHLGVPQHDALLDGVDLCVVNPAIKPDHPLLQLAQDRGVAITQEINLFLEQFPGRVVLVTGTNGKSTTASLLYRSLARGGFDVRLGGNIGFSLLDEARTWNRNQVAVLEVSSAQLSRIDPSRHRVTGAIATRITQDHLDWHGSLEAYRTAKQRAFAAAESFVIHARDDATAESAPTSARIRVRFAADKPGDHEVGLDAGWLVSRVDAPHRVLHPDAANLVGTFHTENLAAAAAASELLGVDAHRTGLALARMRPLPNRLQLVAVHDGRRIFGNAVSTEIQSTLSALRSVSGPIHWVGGGKSKDGDYAAVADQVAPLIASAHLFGTAAPILGRMLDRALPTTCHERLDQALEAAAEMARSGDAVVFSPAFASFDQFSNFSERAAVFDDWVSQRVRARAPRPALDASESH